MKSDFEKQQTTGFNALTSLHCFSRQLKSSRYRTIQKGCFRLCNDIYGCGQSADKIAGEYNGIEFAGQRQTYKKN